MEDTRTCRDVLMNIEREDPTAWLYLPSTRDWSLESMAMVLQSEEVAPEEEDQPDAGVPREAKEIGLTPALPITVVQDIVSAARNQQPDAPDERLFEAFLHYFRHDAFLKMDS
jgi:hypothetical protein